PTAGKETIPYLGDALKSGEINFAVEDPDAPENIPRSWAVWRANTLGSSAKGERYFLKHLLGVDNTVGAEETPEEFRPKDVKWREESPGGEMELVVTLDFRVTGHTLHSGAILPPATRYWEHA